jgi:all-trans-retinol 13,14-reductase
MSVVDVELAARFPEEQRGISRFFEVITRLAADVRRSRQLLAFPGVLALPLRAPTLARWMFSTLSSLLEATITDPLLKAVLSARSGNNALPPSEVSLPFHAAMESYYYGGAYYPQGGAKALSAAYVKALRRNGGSIRVKSRLKRILLDGERASGCCVAGWEAS